MTELADLESQERLALARHCFDRLGVDAIEEGLDEDDNLVRTGVHPSGRRFSLVAHLDEDEDEQHVFGDIDLRVEVENRVGRIELVLEPDAPDPERMAPVALGLCANDPDPEIRDWMQEASLGLGSDFLRLVREVLDRYEHHSLRIGSSALEVGLLDLTWDEEDWASCTFDIPGEVDLLASIAAVLEQHLPDTLTVCSFCSHRFNAGSSAKCPHCGGAL